jgi:flagellar hook assembly protein FlgD
MRLTVSGLTGYGWRVEPLVDGTAAPPIVEGVADGTAAEFTWSGLGMDDGVAPDGTYLLTVWAANGPDNRSQAQKVVTLDTQPPALIASTTLLSIRPNIDGRSATTSLGMTASETVSGRARVFDSTGRTVRTWKFSGLAVGAWTWDGTDTTGTFVPDGTYSFRLDGVDAAGNGTVQQTPVLVDRTIGNITWASSSFRPDLGATDRLSLKLLRPATVSVSIYQGTTLVRRAWIDKAQAVGTWSWSWNGRNGHGELVGPGTYTASVTATSAVGVSRLTRTVTVGAP